MICKQDALLRVGRDLVDCLTSPLQSHGEIEIAHRRWYRWVSSLSCIDAERVIRAFAQQEHQHISCFVSQGLPAPFQRSLPLDPPLHRGANSFYP